MINIKIRIKYLQTTIGVMDQIFRIKVDHPDHPFSPAFLLLTWIIDLATILKNCVCIISSGYTLNQSTSTKYTLQQWCKILPKFGSSGVSTKN